MSYDSALQQYGAGFSPSITFSWRGPWNPAFVYTRGNLVGYGLSTYLAKGSSMGQQPSSNSIHWDTFAEGQEGASGSPGPMGPPGIQGIQGSAGQSFNYRGAWVSGTNYALDDAVNYGGSLYITNVAIPNSTQVPSSSVSWTLLVSAGANGTNGINGNNGVNGTSFVWSGPFVYQNNYVINDVVYYDGSCYMCIANVNSSNYPNLATSYWQLMVSGLSWKGTYNSGTTYNINDIVYSVGSSYISLANSNVGNVLTNTSFWATLAQQGATGQGVLFTNQTHSTLNAYSTGNVVLSSGGNDGISGVLYIAVQNVPSFSQSNSNILLTNTTYWAQFGGTPGATGSSGSGNSITSYAISGYDVQNSNFTSNVTLSGDLYCINLTLGTNVILNANGYRIFVSNTLTMGTGSVISNNGSDGTSSLNNGVPGAGAPSGTVGGGGAGGACAGNSIIGGPTTEHNSLGGNGGSSSQQNGASAVAPSASAGGLGVLNIISRAILARDVTGALITGGAGGGCGVPITNTQTNGQGGPANWNCGGGGGGGVLVIAAFTIVGNGSITANGGLGSTNPEGTNGSGSGGGGVCIVITNSSIPSGITIQAISSGLLPGAPGSVVVLTSPTI